MSGWTRIGNDEAKAWRKDLPKGHMREYRTAHTTGYQQVESDGDTVAMEAPKGPARPEDPRVVREDLTKQIVDWALASPENAHLAAQVARNHNPEYAELTDEEIIAGLVLHAEKRAEEATKTVYRQNNKWDRGTNLDHVQSKELWLPSQP